MSYRVASIDPIRIHIDRCAEAWGERQMSASTTYCQRVEGRRRCILFTPVWNDCPHTLHVRSPVLLFLSILTITEFSWLQNKHWNVVARGSR